ncbi:MAG: hypothetical protein M3540_02485 [Actinomycetota bacterium]|nr:hypothetical protein [Actinomycetota bacterium]
MRAVRLVGALIVLGCAVLAGPAGAAPARDALIRPGVGIGRIELNMRLAEVRRVLGKPTSIAKRRRLGFGSEFVEYRWGEAPNWRVGVLGRPGNQLVIMVATGLSRERTSTGVGVGSTYTAARRRLGAGRCRINSKPGGLAYNAFCSIGLPGRTRTLFSFFGTCSLPPRTVIVCPTNRRTFTVGEVLVGTGYGLQLSG